MRKFLVLMICTLTLSACASVPTKDPLESYAKAAVHLRTSKTAIVAAATAISTACQSGIVADVDCAAAAAAYTQAQLAWKAAAAALLASLDSGETSKLVESLQGLSQIEKEILSLSAPIKEKKP